VTATIIGPGGAVDVTDRAARLLGRVTVEGGLGGGSTDGATEATLAEVLTELTTKFEAGQAVALDANTLAALETITAVVSGVVAVANLPDIQPVSGTVAISNPTANPETGLAKDATLSTRASETKLEAVRSLLAATLAVAGTVALDGPTLAALETITVANFPAVQPVNGTVAVSNMVAATETGLAKDATLSPVRDRFAAVQTAKATYTTPGDHTLIPAPASPLALRPVWLFAQAKGALDTGTVIVSITLGGRSYEFELTGSQPFAHSAVWDGEVGDALIVNTSSAAAVMVNVDYRLYLP
jgi:hypothetical protein